MGGFLISVFIYAGAGAIYGLFYAYSISRICRILQRTPRVKPHFLAIHLILMLAIMIHMAPATMIVAATVAGIIVAVANPVKRVQTDGGSPFDTE